MKTYQVTLEMVVLCPLRLCVEAESKEEALDLAASLVPTNVSEAHATKNGGWKATVRVSPPKGAILNQYEFRATHITQSSGRWE